LRISFARRSYAFSFFNRTISEFSSVVTHGRVNGIDLGTLHPAPQSLRLDI
jgi:hypothetical protein